MAKYRNGKLPQCVEDKICLLDGGLETHLVFHKNIDLPVFGAFLLLGTDEGTSTIKDYFVQFAKLASKKKLNFLMEAPTWRASRDWAAKVGVGLEELEQLNRKAVDLLCQVRDEYESEDSKMVISARVGPRGDGYVVDTSKMMSPSEAHEYHQQQINWLADTNIDVLMILTMNYASEAIGAVNAAKQANVPVTVSFVLETDGCLPNGQTLKDAIEEVDGATAKGPLYYMINCSHPTHFAFLFNVPQLEPWMKRIKGVQPNASSKSHAELNESSHLDSGNPVEFGIQVADLRRQIPHLNILGGCCGTDYNHIEQIANNCT